jgi:hypothetical protein
MKLLNPRRSVSPERNFVRILVLEMKSKEGRSWLDPSLVILTIGVFLSGGAGLINQVVWQKALKVYLGGSETISSMIVVLVFLAGLGTGSVWMVKKAHQIQNPARALALIEATPGIRQFRDLLSPESGFD